MVWVLTTQRGQAFERDHTAVIGVAATPEAVINLLKQCVLDAIVSCSDPTDLPALACYVNSDEDTKGASQWEQVCGESIARLRDGRKLMLTKTDYDPNGEDEWWFYWLATPFELDEFRSLTWSGLEGEVDRLRAIQANWSNEVWEKLFVPLG